jgi:hypothetical protein
MKTIALVVALLTASCLAESTPHERISLELGSVIVYLGMPEADLLKRCADAGLKVTNTGVGEFAIVEQRSGANKAVYMATTRGGRVVWAMRSWSYANMEPHEVVMKALIAFSKYGQNCAVTSSPQTNPESSSERIFISCGHRTLRLMTVKFTGEQSPTFDVSESIGDN